VSKRTLSNNVAGVRRYEQISKQEVGCEEKALASISLSKKELRVFCYQIKARKETDL